ncbi:MAG: hypothetical protein FWF52_04250 [Candidatus Azobacteroides sp.]|nr:hypothetical protein [Candidatus Azobacteroides sp.]
MAANKILKWGKMILEIALNINGVIGVFKAVMTPVQGSFALTVEEGDKLEAFIEGGERIAMRRDKNKYSFSFEMFITNDMPKPIPDVDGIIADEYAIRVIPENKKLEGFLMERASVSVTETFTSAEGHKVKYTFDALQPETGALIKPYTAPAA